MVIADSIVEANRSNTAKGLEARIIALKKRLKIEEERHKVLFEASNHTVAVEKNI